VTVTVTDLFVVPPVPVQAREKVASALSVAVCSVPVIAFEPLQAPDAVQLDALSAVQESVARDPLATFAGLAVNETVGALAGGGGDGAELTVTDAVLEIDPPVPVQFSVKAASAVSAAVCSEPLAAFVPVQPPVAVHEVTFVDDHVSVDREPEVTAVGLAVIVNVGAGGGGGGAAVTVTVTVALPVPPVPVHDRLYVVLVVSGPTDCDPLTDFVPVQPPDDVQLVAFCVVQVRVLFWPDAMLVGDATRFTVGAGAGGGVCALRGTTAHCGSVL
jgi:hypothetical protein